MPRRPDMPPLSRSDLRDDPIEQFAEWYARAAAEVPLADAVCLATVDAGGTPDARMVLLKGVDAAGFRFHTNYRSAKGEQLAGDGRASAYRVAIHSFGCWKGQLAGAAGRLPRRPSGCITVLDYF